jgi:hypothetical protein
VLAQIDKSVDGDVIRDINRSGYIRQAWGAYRVQVDIYGLKVNAFAWGDLPGAPQVDGDEIGIPETCASEWGLGDGELVTVCYEDPGGGYHITGMTVKTFFDTAESLFRQPTLSNDSPVIKAYAGNFNVVAADVLTRDITAAENVIAGMVSPEPPEDPLYKILENRFALREWAYPAEAVDFLSTRGLEPGFNEIRREVLGGYGRLSVWMLFLLTSLLVMGTIVLDLLSKRREVGILKAIGYDGMAVFTLYLLRGALAASLGIAGGITALLILGPHLGVPLKAGTICGAAILAFSVYVMAAAIPADMAKNTTAMDLLLERRLSLGLDSDPLAPKTLQRAATDPLD